MQIALAIMDEVEDLEAGKIQVPKITTIGEDFLVIIAVGWEISAQKSSICLGCQSSLSWVWIKISWAI